GYYHFSRKTDFFMHSFLDIYEFCNTLYMDSTGLGVFIALLKAVKKNDGKLEFIGVSKRLKRLFDITGLTEILNLNSDFEKVERR
ncbi:STAS domain-containing protein, partial [Bacillus cereus]|uniref:STAS domain-containing protein n=1 Tax=Bacillus cereus TaxID=1396 RepID=UPI0020A40F6A